MADARTGDGRTRRPRQPSQARTVVQMPRFVRNKKRCTPKQQLAIDDAVREILTNPLIGERKTGALRAVHVHKFKIGSVQLLLAYMFDDKRNVIEAWAVGPHENFYRDLQEYMKTRVAQPGE